MTDGRGTVEGYAQFFTPEQTANAEYDSLTGTLSYRSFHELASQIIRVNADRGMMVDIVYLNIEDFKAFNERYGFEEGNALIVSLADCAAEAFPERLIGRAAGDRFVILAFNQETAAGIHLLEEEFQRACIRMPRHLRVGVYHIDDSSTDLVLACDRAKIAADSIRKRYDAVCCCYDEELNRSVRQERYIVEHIEEAIRNRQIRIYYQPVIRTATNEVCSMEALARWQDPNYGLLAPSVFIGTLEEYNLVHLLDSYVIRGVCAQMRQSAEEGKTLIPVSVNLSRKDFELCDINGVVENAVESYQIPKELIRLEITESALINNAENISRSISRFHEKGFKVWLDDFGSGYSSLNILKEFDFDLLKIDMAFLRNVTRKSQRIIAAVVAMAKQIGLRTLAEGVETSKQLQFLQDIGCEMAQGYFIGRPAPYRSTILTLDERGFEMEQKETRAYYDELAKSQFRSTWEGEDGVVLRNAD